MLEVGVCGTDKEICRFEYGTPPPGQEYLVLGHESLGEVVEVGPGVTKVAPGDLVVVMVRRPCGVASCLACRGHQQDFCYSGSFTERGINQIHGFMTGFVVDEEEYLCKVPRELREIAVLTEPLTIAEKAIIQLERVQQRLPWGCQVQPGKGKQYCHNAVVLGAGPVGILGAMALAVRGFQTYVYSRELPDAPRAQLVESFGATYISSQLSNAEQLASQVGNLDVVYEATGYAPVSFDVMRVLGTNGVFIFTGIPGPQAAVPTETDDLMRNMVLKNQMVFGTVNANRTAFENAIADLQAFEQQFPEATRRVITRRYAMGEYEQLLTGKAEGIKNVISMEGAV